MIRKLLTPVLAGFVAGKAIKWYANQKKVETKKAHKQQMVDTSSEDSFPASDAPSWNAVHMLGAPKQTA